MKLNEEKLTAMVEAVMKVTAPKRPTVENDSLKLFRDSMDKSMVAQLRTALTPFCMEMTDEEIWSEADKQSALITDADELIGWEMAFYDGAKFIRDGN